MLISIRKTDDLFSKSRLTLFLVTFFCPLHTSTRSQFCFALNRRLCVTNRKERNKSGDMILPSGSPNMKFYKKTRPEFLNSESLK